MRASSPWAVLLCKFRDDDTEPYDRQRYRDLFTRDGLGKSGMVDYFDAISHGQLDIGGSEVFGWFTIDKNRAEYLGLESRGDILGWARQAAASAGVDLSPFFSIVVVMNVPTDLFGGPDGVCCDDGRLPDNGMSGLSPSFLGQEMLHGYNLDHARTNGSEEDYTDRYDIMSTAAADMAPHPIFVERDMRGNPVFLMGPGLNAASMDALGWLDRGRVWASGARRLTAEIRLRPLHRRDLPGYLAARIGDVYLEYREPRVWDGGLSEAVVLAHRFQDGHSYLAQGRSGGVALRAGDAYGDAPPAVNHVQFASLERVEILTVDSEGQFADIRVIREPGFAEPTIGVEVTFGGISRGGEGIVVLPGGGVRKVPPHSPWAAILTHVALQGEGLPAVSLGLQAQARREALTQVVAIATRELAATPLHHSPSLTALTPCVSTRPSLIAIG